MFVTGCGQYKNLGYLFRLHNMAPPNVIYYDYTRGG